jgi:hypothetical protein
VHLSHHSRVLATGLAALGVSLALAGCGSGQGPPDESCAPIGEREAEYRDVIMSLGKAIEAGATTDREALAVQERAWANLVLGHTQCFPAEKVAVAQTLLTTTQP